MPNPSQTKFGNLKIIKSRYILQKIFNFLLEEKKSNITIYNKEIQLRLQLSIENYKNLFEQTMKLEIIFTKKNQNYIYYYTINEEKKFSEYYKNYEKNFEKIKIIIEKNVKSFRNFFTNCEYIKKINFIRFNRNDIEYMKEMFSGCSSLEEIVFSNFESEHVIDMAYMFNDCKTLKKINISNFNTSNATDMSDMFQGCKSLKVLNISNFNTSNVTDMDGMFYGCESL